MVQLLRKEISMEEVTYESLFHKQSEAIDLQDSIIARQDQIIEDQQQLITKFREFLGMED